MGCAGRGIVMRVCSVKVSNEVRGDVFDLAPWVLGSLCGDNVLVDIVKHCLHVAQANNGLGV